MSVFDELWSAIAMAAAWRPGDPLYETETVSYANPSMPTSGPCSPSCWCHFADATDQGMRWTPPWPALQFLPDGLHAADPLPDSEVLG